MRLLCKDDCEDFQILVVIMISLKIKRMGKNFNIIFLLQKVNKGERAAEFW